MLLELGVIVSAVIAAVLAAYHWLTMRQAKKDGAKEVLDRVQQGNVIGAADRQRIEEELRRLPADDTRRQRLRDRYTRPDN